MKDVDEAQLKADVDEIMKRVNSIMEKVEALDPGKAQDSEGEESP
jgi:hypothetical protein